MYLKIVNYIKNLDNCYLIENLTPLLNKKKKRTRKLLNCNFSIFNAKYNENAIESFQIRFYKFLKYALANDVDNIK